MGYKMKLIKLIIACSIISLLFFFGYAKLTENMFFSSLEEASSDNEIHYQNEYDSMKIRNDYKVVIISVNGGELSYAEYFKYSAEKLGWKVKIFNKETLGHEDEILAFDPDFIILACYANPELDSRITAHRSKKYSLNFVPFQLLRDKGLVSINNPYKAKKNLAQMNKIVHGVLTVAQEIEIYDIMFKNLKKDFYGLRIFPVAPDFAFEPSNPSKLMWMGSGWDSYRNSLEYKKFITLLAKNIPFRAYGHYNSLNYLPKETYGGYIFPGIENIKAIRKNGVYLVTHSDYHFKGNVPSMRPFEAAAANAIIISDRLPFLVENFGDSILYFDSNSDPNAMYEQVRDHYEWIKNNPNLAKEKAAKANKIFREKFTLEHDLIKIAKMHEYVLQQDKIKWNLDYPIGF